MHVGIKSIILSGLEREIYIYIGKNRKKDQKYKKLFSLEPATVGSADNKRNLERFSIFKIPLQCQGYKQNITEFNATMF